MKTFARYAGATGVALLSLSMVTGCKSADQRALDQAKNQAAATNTPQQVQYVNSSGETVTTTVQPPQTPGAAEQVATVVTPPPVGAPKPVSTLPVVGPVPMAPPPADMISQGGGNGVATTADNTAPQGGYPASGTAAQPAPSSAPMNLTVPAGTELAIRVNEGISVKHSYAGERFSGEVAEPILQNGQVVVPRGARVTGRVDEAHRRGHFKGASVLELRLTTMTLNGNTYSLDTHEHVNVKKGKGKRTAGWIGGLTGVGMLVGGVASGGVGLAVGAASGAGVGTLIAGTTGNRDINIPAESVVRFRLADDLVVQSM